MCPSMAWMVAQIKRVSDGRSAMPLQVPRYSPHNTGVIVKGSATDAVLLLLQERPLAWLTHAQIMASTGRNTKAVCWACLYLTSRGLVESGPDASRNPRYRRYRLVAPAAPASKVHG